MHFKPIAVTTSRKELLKPGITGQSGDNLGADAGSFIKAVEEHRHWDRDVKIT